MKTLKRFIETSSRELPQEPFARWASVFLSLSALAILFSIAASQLFLAFAGVFFLLAWVRRPWTAARNEKRDSKVEPLQAETGLKFRGSLFDVQSLGPVVLPICLFCLFTLLSLLWASSPDAGGYQIRKLVLFLIVFFSLSLIVSLKHLERLLGAMFIGSAIAAVMAAIQFVIQYHAVRIEYPGRVYARMVLTRITGFQGDWMNFGGQQMLVWVMLVAFLLLRKRRKGGNDSGTRPAGYSWFWWPVWGVIALSILLNFTRSVWLGSFVAGLYLVGRWKARWLWAAPALAIGLFLFTPHLVRKRLDSIFHPSRDPSLAERFEMWHAGLRMIKRHPWLGVGPNNIYEVYDLYLPPGKPPRRGYHDHLHNDYIQFAAERGLPCLAAWLWLMGVLGWKAFKVSRSAVPGSWIAGGAFAAWLAFMVEGFFEFNFGTSPVLMLFLFLATTPFIVERIGMGEMAPP